jgi:thymidylate synthase (FAD)
MTEITFTDKMTVDLIKTDIDDETVLHAARVSTKGELGTAVDWNERDHGLLRYLMREQHMSPFEHGSVTFFIHCPIFVAREFMRHRTWSFNEESGRYRQLEPVFYLPNAGRPLVQEGKVGHYTFAPGTEQQYLSVEHNLQRVYTASYNAYNRLLEEGIAREVARAVLPVGIYTSFYATAKLRNVLEFLNLRLAENALFEIRDVAHQIQQHMKIIASRTMIAWEDFSG